MVPVDFLVLVCDATKEEDFSDLELTLSTLPVAWWTSSAIVITKSTSSLTLEASQTNQDALQADLRRRAYDGTDIFALCAGYTPHYPIFSTTVRPAVLYSLHPLMRCLRSCRPCPKSQVEYDDTSSTSRRGDHRTCRGWPWS